MLYAMSDIHGHFNKLMEFFDKAKKVKLFKQGDKLIFMGDYIDGGKDSFKVIHKIYALAKEYQDNIVVLRGNHEEWFLRFLDNEGNDWIGEDSHFKTSKTFLSKEQLQNLEEMRANDNNSQMLYDYIRKCMNERHTELIAWLRALPYYYETKKQIFVHAGIEENVTEEWKDNTSKEDFIGKYPPTFGQFKKDIIAGHVAAKDAAEAYIEIKGVKEADLKYQGRIFWDKENHFYIDGGLDADDRGNLFCLAYSEENDYYRDIYFEENKLRKARIGKNKAPKGVPQNERDY